MISNKNIKPVNDKGKAHGYWERYLENTLWYKRYHDNGIPSGYEECYEITLKNPKNDEVLINFPMYIAENHLSIIFNL